MAERCRTMEKTTCPLLREEVELPCRDSRHGPRQPDQGPGRTVGDPQEEDDVAVTVMLAEVGLKFHSMTALFEAAVIVQFGHGHRQQCVCTRGAPF